MSVVAGRVENHGTREGITVAEFWEFLRYALPVIGTVAGAWVGAYWNGKSTDKALDHSADEARKQREHEDRHRQEEAERAERLRVREERKQAHAECIGVLAGMVSQRPSSRAELAEETVKVDTAVAVVQLVAGPSAARAALRAKHDAITALYTAGDGEFSLLPDEPPEGKIGYALAASHAIAAYVEAASRELGSGIEDTTATEETKDD